MPSEKISAMPAASTLDNADVFPIVRAGANLKASIGQVKNDMASTPVSTFPNDVPYTSPTDVASTPVSSFPNDVPYLSQSDLTTVPVSTFPNDSGYYDTSSLSAVNVSTFPNDVPYLQNPFTETANGMVTVQTGNLTYDDSFTFPSAGSITTMGTISAGALSSLSDIQLPNGIDTALLYVASGSIVQDADIFRNASGSISLTNLTASGTLSVAGNNVFVNTAGDIACQTVNPANGFSGSGVFTTFTIVNGIITAAS